MISPPSGSEPAADPAQAFARLHPRVQAWVWEQNWRELRRIQARAIAPILAGDQDLIISAATASGKTEAAWLPIMTALAGSTAPGIGALLISPLKALINDQALRLAPLGEAVGHPVIRRHGDVIGPERDRLWRSPTGVLLITPESLEAQFVTRGDAMPRRFAGLRYIVVDELHAFIGTERGAQLQSLLHRLELAIRRRVPRIALSATLADTGVAATFLRPDQRLPVTIITGDADERSELQLQLRGYVVPAPVRHPVATALSDAPDTPGDSNGNDAIASHLFKVLRGKDNLVFANSRRAVEAYADRLQRLSERERVPNEFFPHHGSLARELREDVERRLKSVETPATAVCTSTLELGIDIGSADAVAQIGAPASVAGLRQRLGRTGRRGQPAVLRLYVDEDELTPAATAVDQLRVETVQMIAATELLLARWLEPPNLRNPHLSTLIQQVLSVIAQFGGARARELYQALCETGPFTQVTPAMFRQLLLDLGAADLISQAGDGTLLPGVAGERLINHYSFYAAFSTAEEYRLVANGRTLGAMPIETVVLEGSFLVFAGRRWRVLRVDAGARVIELERARGGKLPKFSGPAPLVADGIRAKMRELYGSAVVPVYLDRTAQRLLAEGRAAYRRLRLDRAPFIETEADTSLFIWRGDQVVNTIQVMLSAHGLKVTREGLVLACARATGREVRLAIWALATGVPPAPLALAQLVAAKEQEKYDAYLGPDLLNAAYAARNLDVPGALTALREVIAASGIATDGGGHQPER